MEVDSHAPVFAQRQIFIEASPQTVWNILTDINNYSKWQTAISVSKLESPLKVGSVFRLKTYVGSLKVTFQGEIQVINPNQEIGWTGGSFGARAKHIWRLSPQNNGTLVITEESITGWSTRLIKLFNRKFLEKSLDTWSKNLKTEAEKQTAKLRLDNKRQK
jgi:carbon monoxide dehydrogenase subunit G